eukprot:gnl/Hemi2/18528_TR6126_c0_g1_i1.p1 gnl/Hemi2/18528_TR6126_c0_g1~~gnl/Hemi2/18528_TR6126_c0_g1_i1.p1  ORF type:complete len:331 (-),score=46.10 gnl/Hemi2/18528_TR6126_c0_g1_i1:105-1097(-)
MATSIRDIFDAVGFSVIHFLETHAGVEQVHFAERPAVTQTDIFNWEMKNSPCKLPEDYKNFLLLSDGLLLRWQAKMAFGATKTLLPLGNMHLNPLKMVARLNTASHPPDEPPDDALRGVNAFDLDSSCLDGHVALYYSRDNFTAPEVWFQDLSCQWHFIAKTVVDYFRLMFMHLGLPRWQYAFTDVGLDPICKQWFRFLSPERFCFDLQNSSQPGKASKLKNQPFAQPSVVSQYFLGGHPPQRSKKKGLPATKSKPETRSLTPSHKRLTPGTSGATVINNKALAQQTAQQSQQPPSSSGSASREQTSGGKPRSISAPRPRSGTTRQPVNV